ncbi:MAG: hypothetical protein JNK89_07260 [Saprospiraceae bacterium]|nr:hypothetical protein [Saprospiraceae bacterium]
MGKQFFQFRLQIYFFILGIYDPGKTSILSTPMHHSKLLELLRQFNGRQLSRFRDFLASPYFNRTGELALFFQYLAPHAPAF